MLALAAMFGLLGAAFFLLATREWLRDKRDAPFRRGKGR